MHISEGILSPPVLVAGGALTLIGLAWGLRGLEGRRLVASAMLAALFFVVSLIHVPIGPAHAHFVLNGLLGLLVGRAAFPAIFAAMILQALLFQDGGLTVLGVNTFCMAFPAIFFAWIFSPLLRASAGLRALGTFLCGALPVLGSAFLASLALGVSDEGFLIAARLLFVANLPVMLVEGLITALVAAFIFRVRPEFFRL